MWIQIPWTICTSDCRVMALLFHIREVPDSCLSAETAYPDRIFIIFPSPSRQCRSMPYLRTQFLPSTSFQIVIQCSLIMRG